MPEEAIDGGEWSEEVTTLLGNLDTSVSLVTKQKLNQFFFSKYHCIPY